MRVLITGGAGFIGSNFIRYILGNRRSIDIVVLDKLTYAGNESNLIDLREHIEFIKGDIYDEKTVDRAVKNCDQIINFAAESHVDRSLTGPRNFVLSNVLGTLTLLEAVRKHGTGRFIHISTDEVYGSREKGSFAETDRLKPSSPYSATKASADHLTLAYHVSHGIPAVITRSSNNFGPYQHPEKFIPTAILSAIREEKIPIYGNGKNVRDWLFVSDNCDAIDFVRRKGKPGEIYNVGAGNEYQNIDVAKLILSLCGKSEDILKFVEDRKGHDFRYSVNTEKIRELGWRPHHAFQKALEETVRWYQNNETWWKKLL